MSLRSPLARVKGLGTAKEGTGHWWHQRLTALALVPLTLWLCFAIAALPAAGHAVVVGWIASPINAVLLITLLAVSFYHGYLGLQVVMEDYVHPHWLRTTLVVAAGFCAFLLTIASVFMVLKIAFER